MAAETCEKVDKDKDDKDSDQYLESDDSTIRRYDVLLITLYPCITYHPVPMYYLSLWPVPAY